jgi:gamma-glutamyltranspeptidase/glutathione hydrolase
MNLNTKRRLVILMAFLSTEDQVAELSSARSGRAVVTAAAPIAASIGAHVLYEGGNVFDAAVAAALAETVLLPPKCGLAGDLVALVVRAGDPAPTAMISIGAATARQVADVVAHGLPAVGPLSVGAPGAPAGYAALHEWGSMPLHALAAPAIALARNGFPWSPIAEALTRQARNLLVEQNPQGTPYLVDGQPIAAGTIVRLPGLAEVLEEFVQRGPLLFDGPVGDAAVAGLHERGRTVPRAELVAGRAEVTEAVHARVGGLSMWATPSPTHGHWLLRAMEACRDPDDPVSLFEAVERTVAERRSALHDDRGGGTSVVSAADAEGNAVIVVHSNSYQRYGSGVVVAPYGLILANRAGRGFSSDPDHPNFPRVGRRPATTLHAWAVGHPDREGVAFLGATPGGENQMRWNAQTLAAILGGVRDPGRLVAAPRWGRSGDETLVESAAESDGDVRLLPIGTGRRVPWLTLRSAQQVVSLGNDGFGVCAGADPRTGARAVGL